MEIRVATQDDMDDVYKLTYEAYISQGYCEPNKEGKLIHYPHLDNIPETTVLIAIANNEVIGTNSITIDGSNGLHVDDDFPEEVEQFRQRCKKENRILSSSWRIATKEKSLSLIKALVFATAEQNFLLGVDEQLFSFNPRHEKIYRRLIGLQTVAVGHCHATNAEAVLMHTHIEDTISYLEEYRKKESCRK